MSLNCALFPQGHGGCTWAVIDGVLIIVDTRLPHHDSVTNNIPYVLKHIQDEHGFVPALAIYRDSEGRWDGIAHDEGLWSGYHPIGESQLAPAVEKLKKLVRNSGTMTETDAFSPTESDLVAPVLGEWISSL